MKVNTLTFSFVCLENALRSFCFRVTKSRLKNQHLGLVWFWLGPWGLKGLFWDKEHVLREMNNGWRLFVWFFFGFFRFFFCFFLES